MNATSQLVLVPDPSAGFHSVVKQQNTLFGSSVSAGISIIAPAQESFTTRTGTHNKPSLVTTRLLCEALPDMLTVFNPVHYSGYTRP